MFSIVFLFLLIILLLGLGVGVLTFFDVACRDYFEGFGTHDRHRN